MMASALDSVGDKKTVRTEIPENYRFLLVAFTDSFTTESHLASLVYIRLELQLIIPAVSGSLSSWISMCYFDCLLIQLSAGKYTFIS